MEDSGEMFLQGLTLICALGYGRARDMCNKERGIRGELTTMPLGEIRFHHHGAIRRD